MILKIELLLIKLIHETELSYHHHQNEKSHEWSENPQSME